MSGISIGLQLFSVKNEMEKDLESTLQKVSGIGYRYVELPVKNNGKNGSFKPSIPQEVLKEHFEKYDLKVIASHISYEPELNLEQVGAYNLALGSKKVIIPSYFFSTKQDAYDFATWLNEAGKEFQQQGLHLYYHNHYHEFQELDGEVVMDILIDQTDPSLVSFEFDTFWAVRAGVNPIHYLDRLGDRCNLIHQKDLNKQADPVNLLEIVKEKELTPEKTFSIVKESDFVEIGTGKLDVPSIIEKAKEMKQIEYIIVEQDRTTKSELESVEESFHTLNKLLKD